MIAPISARRAALYAWQATREKLGRITRRTETLDGTTTITDYRYDLAGRLDQVDIKGVLAADYAYDSNSNRLSVTRGSGAGATTESGTYGAQDRLLTYAGHAYTWTANGELATRTHVASGAQLTTVSDSQGNLREATLRDGRVVACTVDGFIAGVAGGFNRLQGRRMLRIAVPWSTPFAVSTQPPPQTSASPSISAPPASTQAVIATVSQAITPMRRPRRSSPSSGM